MEILPKLKNKAAKQTSIFSPQQNKGVLVCFEVIFKRKDSIYSGDIIIIIIELD